MQTQTSLCPSLYKAQELPNRQYSLLNDKDEVKQLLIGEEPCDQFDRLYIYDHGIIEAQQNFKCYLFNADLTPIALQIGEELRVAFDWLYICDNGFIIALYDRQDYLFKPDFTPIV